jgi:repressor LexA
MSAFSNLTTRQREVFDFIQDKIVNRGYGPTVREIGDYFRISSPNGVMCHLKALEKKGLIEQAERFDFEDWFPQRKNQFALRVKGDSMIEAQIADGDIVVCRRARTAHKGDIVVAVTDDGEATLKYWYPEANRIRLQPANSAMRPIYSRNAQVIAIVTGVIRKVA